MPDPDRLSGAPLSDSEADRLSERYTASWEDPDLPTVEPATLPLATQAPRTSAPAAATAAPRPATAPAGGLSVPAPVNRQKQTLLGIAPIIVGPSQPPPAPKPVAEPAPAPAPASAVMAPPPVMA